MTSSGITLYDSNGIAVFRGTQSPAGGGGSMPGALVTASVLFTEQPTAGVYTATVPLPAGSVFVDAYLYNLAAWACDNAVVAAGDNDDANGYIAASAGFDLCIGSLATPYSGPATPATTGLVGFVLSNAGAYTLQGAASYEAYYAADNALVVTVTTVIGTPPVVPAGSALLRAYYRATLPADAAVFA